MTFVVKEHLRRATLSFAEENPTLSGTEVYDWMLRHFSNATERFISLAQVRKWLKESRQGCLE